MGKINVLSFAVANLIAAGEVVDRPASVIKELLENAIDSGADRITVEIQNGGVTYMRVADNGCGMSAEDLPVAIRRHATSKIKEASDLDGILTLGFRGEALAAIASVSDLRIISKTADAPVGAMLEAHSGEIAGVFERASTEGTTVIVENLFANVPARRKFLKKDVTETMAVSAVVEKIALSHPEISFRLITDGTIRMETAGDGDLKSTIWSVFGKEFASKLIPTELTLDGIEVKGFVGRPDNVRANRNYQNFFINGRYIKSKTAGAALEQAYTSYIPTEKFPACILFLTINPAAVDVNVHPAKLEVKFSNEKLIFEAIYYAVRNAIEANTARPDVTLMPISAPKGRIEQRLSDSQTPIRDGREESLKARQMAATLTVAEPEKKVAEPPQKTNGAFATMTAEDYLKAFVKDPPKEKPKTESPKIQIPQAETKIKEPIKQEEPKQEELKREEIKQVPPAVPQSLEYRILGEAFHSYVLVELSDRMLVVDKHAAHERVLFEQLRAGMNCTDKASQLLMFPIEVMLTSEEIATLETYRSEIEAVGFEFTLGKYTANVSAIPEGIATDAVSDMLAVMAERIKSNTGSAKLTRDIIFEKALYQASCKAAIKAGREYSEEHIRWLIAELMRLPDITVCPHGRPVAMTISKKNLDHQFERT
ncbi:MAG: DNA mismatch repair endonuclease MutL [Clostridia bacterium]|nr:DNA mismatch repair endonuclease MutL [Clostridia bacterium]